MIFLLIKIIVTAGLIVLISEIAKVNDKLGGLIAAMPIMTLLVILWMYYEFANDFCRFAPFFRNYDCWFWYNVG